MLRKDKFTCKSNTQHAQSTSKSNLSDSCRQRNITIKRDAYDLKFCNATTYIVTY